MLLNRRPREGSIALSNMNSSAHMTYLQKKETDTKFVADFLKVITKTADL